MAGRYTGSYLDQLNDWRVVAILADIDRASLVIDTHPHDHNISRCSRADCCGLIPDNVTREVAG